MSTNENIEGKLEKLGRAIGSDEMLLEKVMNQIESEVLSESLKVKSKLIMRRLIMNRFTKFAAAAVIIIAIVLSITILDKSVTPTYAIEQTIEAFKNIRFLHLVRHNEAGQIEDERWIEIGMDGRQVQYRQDTHPNFLAVEDGKSTAVYHKDKNAVVIYDRKDKQYQWIGDLGLFLENLRQQGSIIEQNMNYHGRIAHKILWPMMNAECYVDPETKLPIAIGTTEFSYEQPPPGTFEITIPEGFTVIDKRQGAAATEEPDWLTDQYTADTYFRRARYALAAGQYEQAVELFEYVVEKQPRRNWAWFWLGSAYYELGEYDLAIQMFSKVIEMMGSVSYCNYARGLAYGQKGMHDAAREDLAKTLPWMIQALREPTAAAMFEYADDPTLRDGKSQPTEQQIIVRMINRLRIITGQNFGYDPNISIEENEQAIAAWEDWFKKSGQIGFTPDSELICVPAGPEQAGK
jgi:tetratricopeptide (TPR) repeat protein